MAKMVNDHEFASVVALPAPARYSHFVEQVADWGIVWSLRGQDGWVLAAADDGQVLVPVWPHSRYADACASGNWTNAKPEAIPLEQWLESWTPGLVRDGHGVAVFPIPTGAGLRIEAERLATDLVDACEQY
jgi:hypothetical protein